MKILVISPSPAHLEQIGRHLQDGPSRSIALHEGGFTRLRVLADQIRPSLVILDTMGRDPDGLPLLEQVSAQHPRMAVIMLCAHHTPEFLILAMRAGVREVLGSPVAKDVLLAAVARIEQRLGVGAAVREPATIAAFIPCKGGSGATFLATNLAHQLSTEGKKVLVVDLNLQLGDAVLFLHDGRPAANLADVARNIHRLDASFLAGNVVKISPSLHVLAAPEDPGQAIEVRPEHIDALLNVAAAHYDFVVLDLGRYLDAVTLKALDRAKYVFPVVQLTLPFLRDASRLVSAFRTLGYARDKLRLLVNRVEKASEIKLADVERILGLAAFRTVPNAYEAVTAAVNHGQPLSASARGNPVAKALQDLAHTLMPAPAEAEGLFGRLLRRA